MKSAHEKIILDDVDKYLLEEHTWCINGQGYPMTNIKDKKIEIHHFILPKKTGFVIDHINRNKLDNRRSNLRYATRSQNCMNRGMMKSNTSGYRGISWHKPSKKWQVRISYNHKMIALGTYSDIEEAARVYKNKAVELFETYLGDLTK